MRIYIVGPMRGKPDWNWKAFETAEGIWTSQGHVVFNPCRMAKASGYTHETSGQGNCPKHLRHVILADVACIMTCDAIGVLPGWEASVGGTVEVALAQFLDLPIYDALTMKVLTVKVKPWKEIADALVLQERK